MLNHAIDSRSFECIKYLIEEEGYTITEEHFNQLTGNTHFNRTQILETITKILKYLHKCDGWKLEEIEQSEDETTEKVYRPIEKCPWNETTILNTIKQGNLEGLVYLHQNDCQWSSDVFKIDPTQYRHSEDVITCIKYARDNKCPGWWYFWLY